MNIIPEVQPERENYIGSADIAAILQLEGAYNSPYSCWANKVFGQTDNDNAVLSWGRRLEPVILEAYQEQEGAGQLVHLQAHYSYKPWPIARATLDGVARLGSDLVVVEAKTTKDYKWDEIPLGYEAQVQWQMGVSGIKQAHLATLFLPSRDFKVFSIEFDETIFSTMLERADHFWQMVEAGTPPEVDGHNATTEALKRIIARGGVADISHLTNEIQKYQDLKAQVKALELEADEISNRIKASLGDCTIGFGPDGKEVATWKEQKTTRFDQTRFKTENPDLYQKYVIESRFRVLRFKGGK